MWWKYLAAIVLCVGAGWGSYRYAYGQGEGAGRLAVQVQWDKAQLDQAAQNARDRQAEEVNRVAAEKRLAQLQSDLDGSDRRGAALARSLRDAQAAAASAGLPAGANPGSAAPAGGKPGSAQTTEEFVADAFATCERDGSRLDALIETIKSQL